MKKQEITIKKLIDTNGATIKENLNLLDENTKLIMSCGMFTKFPENEGGNHQKWKKTYNQNLRDS